MAQRFQQNNRVFSPFLPSSTSSVKPPSLNRACLLAYMGKISQHKKKRQPAVRRKKWVDLEQQHNQCDQYDFDKAEEFLEYHSAGKRDRDLKPSP